MPTIMHTLQSLRAVALVVALLPGVAQAGSDIVWRVHYRFPNGKEGALDLIFESSRECHDYLTDVSMAAMRDCKTGDVKGCSTFRDSQNSSCRPERVP